MAKAATRRSRAIPQDEDGKPDIYVLVNDQGMKLLEASEAAGLNLAQGAALLYKQEVQHNPELFVGKRLKGQKMINYVVKERDENKVRWERLAHRTGLSVAALQEMYEEATGISAKRTRGTVQGEEPAAPKKGKKKAKVPPPPVDEEEEDEEDIDEEDEEDEDEEPEDEADEDDEEDEEDDEEEPEPAPKARARKSRRS